MTGPDDDGGGPEDRAPQHDPVAEQSTLGAVLLAGTRALDTLAEDVALRPDHFFRPAHGLIYAACLALRDAGDPIDPSTVLNRLREQGVLTQAGGAPYLHTLVQGTPSPDRARYYGRIVRARAMLRWLGETGTRIQQLAEAGIDGHGGGDVEAIITAAEAEFGRVMGGWRPQKGAGISDDLDAVLDEIESGVAAIPTPWLGLNEMFGGWRPGELVVFGAYTGGGKSIAGGQAALHLAMRRGEPAAICSMEMTRATLVLRAISNLGRVDLASLSRGGSALSDRDWQAIASARHRLETGGPGGGPVPLWIEDRPAMTLGDVRAAYRACCQAYGRCRLLVVDFLQLMSSAGRPESRQVEVAANAYGLKGMALDLGITVIALAQLNRDADEAKKPSLRHLRESGAIEQAADGVGLLWRPEEDPDDQDVVLTWAKNRHGRTGDIPLRWEGRHSRILDAVLDDPVQEALA